MSLIRKSLLIVLLGVFAVSCSYENVEVVEVKEFEFTELKERSIKLKAQIQVDNPNSYPVKIKSIDSDIYINGSKAGKLKLEKPIKIQARSNDFVPVEVQTKIEGGSLNILPIVLGAALSKKLEVRVNGNMKASSYIFSRRIEFDYTDKAKF